MKKIIMKKSKLLVSAFISTVLLWVWIAWNVSTTNLSSKYTQCNSNESIDENYYIVWQNYTRDNTRDTFWNSSVTSFISAPGSEVQLWRNNWILSNCSDWSRISNVVEKSNSDRVLALLNFDGCTFNKPNYPKVSDPTAIDAQIHFVIWYYEKKSRPGWTTMTSKFGFKDFEDAYRTCYPDHEQKTDISQCDDTTIRYSTTLKQHKWECINYRVFRCGDWLVNSPYGTDYTNTSYSEQCDPNDPTHSWWNNNGKICNDLCQLVETTPVTPTTCTIDIDPDSLVLWNTWVVSYTISWEFNSPIYMNVSPSLVWAFPYVISSNTWDSITTWDVFVWSNLSTWTYVFTINWVWFPSESEFICTWILNVVEPQLDIEKEIDFISLTWDIIQYTITLTNNNKVVYHNAYIRDKMPQAVSYQTSTIIWVSNYNFGTWTSGGREWFEYSWFDMQPWDVVYVILTGTIAMPNTSISNQISNSPLFMMGGWVEQIANTYYESYKSNVINCAYTEWDEDCAEYPEDEFMSGSLTKLVNDAKTYAVRNIGETITYTISFKNLGNVDWTSYRFVDTLPNEVDFQEVLCNGECTVETWVNTSGEYIVTVSYSGSILAPQAEWMFTIVWRVNSSILLSRSAINWVSLRYQTKLWTGELLDYAIINYNEHTQGDGCGNWRLEVDYYEECDGWYKLDSYINADVTGRFYIFDYLDYTGSTLAPESIAWKWYYCTEDCRLSNTQWDVYDVPSCLNVDTTITVNENELIPFWWRIWQKDKMKFVNWWNSVSCNPSQNGKTVINKDTMKCTFKIYNGHSYSQKNWEPINEIELDCFDDIDWKLDKFFSPFDDDTCQFTWCVDFSKVASRNVFNVFTLLGSRTIQDYWEYKIALSNIDYDYCSSDGTWKKWNMCGSAICEVNFVLTTPYIMQTNTAWVPTATTSNFLNKFYDIAWNKIVTDISDIMKVSTSNYSETANVESEINKFKNKYESLAVKSNVSWWDGIDTVKKVPWKNIYFVSWNGKLVLSASTLWTNPFTVVVTWMDVVISGSVSTNGMIITNKTMSFKDESCLTWWQVVKWIFIAEWWFVKNGTTLNININKPRCHWWNLNVKWVLIWKNIKNLTESKRSQLNSRFDTELRYRNTNDSKLKAERRNEIFQWASLLIEYNPDLWSNTIPWAEIFTETLSVYKK